MRSRNHNRYFTKILFAVFAASVLFSATAFSATINVSPGGSIQAAIDQATAGDIVLVAAGTYTGTGNRNIDFKGKAITVRSANGPTACIIDCQTSGRGFYFHTSETSASVLEGFTIKNGSISGGGGGIFCTGASPTIQNCIVKNCSAGSSSGRGGGIGCDNYAYPAIKNCVIANNTANKEGGGICCSYSGPTVINCTLSGNTGSSGSQAGFRYTNSAQTQPQFTNCIIWGGTLYLSQSAPVLTYCDVSQTYSGTGNINADPLLATDFQLQVGSPCIDIGTTVNAPATDIVGEARPFGAGVDIGAYELNPDKDLDGLLDSWEMTYFNSLSYGPNDDPDNDTYTNLQEYNQGTDPTHPDIIFVSPGGSIQAAIDQATTGDTVLVADGTYSGTGNRNISFNGKAITVRSANGPTACIIDCQSNSRGFYFHTSETSASVLDGFTIKNGSAPYDGGGGIYCLNGASPTIRNCIIRDNTTAAYGGGIYCKDSGTNPSITNCVITGNHAQQRGGGIASWGSKMTVVNCTIVDNTAGGYGPQVSLYNSISPTIFKNSIIRTGFYKENCTPTVTYCNISGTDYDGSNGNIDVDPMLTGDFHLWPESPCIDAGTLTGAPSVDIDGEARPWGNGIDIGADEYVFIDTDEDGLLDTWEMQWFGSLEYGPSDDPDNDGVTNLEEYTQGYNPNGTPLMVLPDGSIQAAIDQALDGDTVLVADGTYTGTGNINIDFGGKAIVVKSVNGPGRCIIDCQNSGRGFYFHSGETSTSFLSGFTIKNGYAAEGGGIRCADSSSPTIKNCIIQGNSSYYDGGGIACSYDNSPLIINCVIADNHSQSRGGGIYCLYGKPSVINCTVIGNSAESYGQQVFLQSVESGTTFKNSIIGQGFFCFNSWPVVTYCNIDGGYTGEGNIDLDPMLTADFHLQAGSPCIDAGTVTGAPETDIDGEARSAVSGIDMGADEYRDDDADGLLDSWEMAWFGSLNYGPNDDPDLDGFTNLEEYTQGTDPTHLIVVRVSQGQSIQAAIDQAVDGDTIIVEGGTYYEWDIDFKGKAITVRSENGPDACIIDCQNSGRGFYFHSDETESSVLSGFTIKNGTAEKGGGIFCHNSASPSITNCIITENTASADGAGVCCDSDYFWNNTHPLLTNCIITNNTAANDGGGIACNNDGEISLINTIIANNTASDKGGGIDCNDGSEITVINCTIVNNTATDSGPQVCLRDAGDSLVFTNSIIGDGFAAYLASTPIVTYCNITGGYEGEGNIDGDPKLTEDFRLQWDSPCIDAGTETDAPETDIDGELRLFNGGIDIGADEFYLDYDQDGLPDTWEREYFDSLVYDADDDPDEDGLPNEIEYLYGTNPNDPINSDNNDEEAPVVIIAYPSEDYWGQPVAPDSDGTVELVVAFGDTGFGIQEVTLVVNGIDVTTDATITDNSIIYVIPSSDLTSFVSYTVTITDYSGNTITQTITFIVEEPILTTVSPEGGSYNTPQAVQFTCNKSATIYYSTDGYPPAQGAANTTAVAAAAEALVPENGISIDHTLCLQFYAEAGGVKEDVRREVYYLNSLPDRVVGLMADATSGNVVLNWSGVSGADSYTVYRCKNAVQKKALEDSINGGYPPPARLAVVSGITLNTYTDEMSEAATRNYWYAVAAVDGAYTGVASNIAAVSITPSAGAATQSEAVSRAIAWLEANQYTEGFWSQGPWNPDPTDEQARAESLRSGRRMLFTSQAANVLSANGNPENVDMLQAALYYLRGHHADNNDYLARTILTLAVNSQNVDRLVAKLIAGSRIGTVEEEGLIKTVVEGWGIQARYDIDAVDTALGILAVETVYPFDAMDPQSKTATARYNLGQTIDLMSAGGSVAAPRYGWVPGGESSVFASALAYKALSINAVQSIYQWIINGQNTDGSFGTGIADTAAALLWLDLPTTDKDAAIAYLVAQQQADGSWNSDTYLTGLCARALWPIF